MDIAISREDGSKVSAYITAENRNGVEAGFANTDTYSVTIGNEPAGQFKFSKDKTEWLYKGGLSNEEQSRIAQFIQAFRQGA